MSSVAEPQDRRTHQRMRLADFIVANLEPILADWEAFARASWPAPASNDPAELRDHALDILRATASDMRSDQTMAQQSAKSMGESRGDARSERLDTASDQHGAGRGDSGFELPEVIAEYRALRASVVRLWRQSVPAPDPHDLDDLTRFHESIDQSLARAVESFADHIEQSRRLFLAILGHDLRSPLAAIRMIATLLAHRAGDDAQMLKSAAQITASAQAMDGMIGDLLDFTAAGLGSRLPLSRSEADLHAICHEVVQEVRAAHPGCTLRYEHHGDLRGQWDAGRLRQVVANLVGNAVRHGGGEEAGSSPIDLNVRSAGAEVELTVQNGGRPIPAQTLPTLFDPLRRVAGGSEAHASEGQKAGRYGLGLFITHQIVTAHGGTIAVASTAARGTTFTVRLPRGPISS